MNPIDFDIKQVTWQEMESHIRSIRSTVFVEEQQVPVELEWDGQDNDCIHLLTEADKHYVATARLLDTGQIGRMAVLKEFRRKGIGSAMLETLLQIARTKNLDSVFLNAQIDATDFYNGFGFYEQGKLFNDAGIMHRRMRKELQV